MRCPSCDAAETRVVDSRSAEEDLAIRRRRQCERCGVRFTTFERVEEQPAGVIKRDGRREPFDRSKVELGVRSACKGSPVDEETIASLVGRVEDRIRLRGGEVESAQVGAMVLEELRPIDGVAAVRFASVHKAFQGPEDFERELRLLGGGSPEPHGADDDPAAGDPG